MKNYITEVNPDYSLLDKHTGEVIEWRSTKVITVDEFIMFFFASVPEIMKLEGLQMKVLICCWKASTYNNVEIEGNLISNNKLFKEYIRQHGLDLSDGAIDVVIHKLAKANILIKKCKGVYMLNPQYFFKGRLSDKSKLELRMITEQCIESK